MAATTRRQAIREAGATGRFLTPVQFSTSEQQGLAKGVMAAGAKLRPPTQCNETLYGHLQSDPELSTLKSLVDKAGE